MTGHGEGGRHCPRDGKRLDTNVTARTYECAHCGYSEQFGTWREPLVTEDSARSLVDLYWQMRAAGEPMPARRVPGIGWEASR